VANISLSNPRNDAEDISAALKQLDFKVVTAINATKRDMDLKLPLEVMEIYVVREELEVMAVRILPFPSPRRA
jgi:hypothetical protein